MVEGKSTDIACIPAYTLLKQQQASVTASPMIYLTLHAVLNMCFGNMSRKQSKLLMRVKYGCSTHLEPRHNVKVLLHISAKHLIDGTAAPHTYQLWR